MNGEALISANRKVLAKQWTLRGLNPKKFKSGDIAPPPLEGFIRGYHLLKVNDGIDDIKQAHLKVSRFSDLNDPFELLALNFHEPSTRKVARKNKSDQDSNRGLLCFSKNWKHPLLWSHYAEKHRGLALGFDVRASRIEGVTYCDKRMRAELHTHCGDPQQIPPDLQKLLRVTKARCWEYEEEVRLIVPLGQSQMGWKISFLVIR